MPIHYGMVQNHSYWSFTHLDISWTYQIHTPRICGMLAWYLKFYLLCFMSSYISYERETIGFNPQTVAWMGCRTFTISVSTVWIYIVYLFMSLWNISSRTTHVWPYACIWNNEYIHATHSTFTRWHWKSFKNHVNASTRKHAGSARGNNCCKWNELNFMTNTYTQTHVHNWRVELEAPEQSCRLSCHTFW